MSDNEQKKDIRDVNVDKLRKRKKARSVLIRNIALTLVCVAIGVIAAVQYRSIEAQVDTDRNEKDVIIDLQSTINTLNAELDAAIVERNELQARLDSVQESSQTELIKTLQDEIEQLRTFVGLTDVQGSGVYVRIAVAETANINSVQNQLLLLINELRASGAQAISINGMRIAAMTEIRIVNESYISVNQEQLVAPYEIYAIGEPGKLYSGITMGGSGLVFRLDALVGVDCIARAEERIVINKIDENLINTNLLTPKE